MDIIKGLFPKFANWKNDPKTSYLIMSILAGAYLFGAYNKSNDKALDITQTMCKEQNDGKDAEIKRLNDQINRQTLSMKEVIEINTALQSAKTAQDILKEAKK